MIKHLCLFISLSLISLSSYSELNKEKISYKELETMLNLSVNVNRDGSSRPLEDLNRYPDQGYGKQFLALHERFQKMKEGESVEYGQLFIEAGSAFTQLRELSKHMQTLEADHGIDPSWIRIERSFTFKLPDSDKKAYWDRTSNTGYPPASFKVIVRPPSNKPIGVWLKSQIISGHTFYNPRTLNYHQVETHLETCLNNLGSKGNLREQYEDKIQEQNLNQELSDKPILYRNYQTVRQLSACIEIHQSHGALESICRNSHFYGNFKKLKAKHFTENKRKTFFTKHPNIRGKKEDVSSFTKYQKFLELIDPGFYDELESNGFSNIQDSKVDPLQLYCNLKIKDLKIESDKVCDYIVEGEARNEKASCGVLCGSVSSGTFEPEAKTGVIQCGSKVYIQIGRVTNSESHPIGASCIGEVDLSKRRDVFGIAKSNHQAMFECGSTAKNGKIECHDFKRTYSYQTHSPFLDKAPFEEFCDLNAVKGRANRCPKKLTFNKCENMLFAE